MSHSKKNENVLAAEELGEYADEHLFYEARMFVVGRQVLPLLPPGDVFLRNAIIEICVLHLKNLIEFFYAEPRRRHDVVAELYVKGLNPWRKDLPSITPTLRLARARANKETEHLTTARVAGVKPEKAWDFEAISRDLRATVSAFLKHADETRLWSKCRQELERI